jgi:ParB-like chromosome segregation protein Spo0J
MTTATMPTNDIGGLTYARTDSIRPSKTNPRKSFNEAELDELAASIRASGIQVPLLVRPAGPEVAHIGCKYIIIAGERRFRAAVKLGLEEVPCLVREISEDEARDIQVVENLQRAGIHPLEEALGYQDLIEAAAGWSTPAGQYFVQRIDSAKGEVVYVCHPRPGGHNIVQTFGAGTYEENLRDANERKDELNAQPREPEKLGVDLTAEDVAKRVGKTTAYVAKRLKLLELTPESRDLYLRGHLTEGHALLLARLTAEDQGRALRFMLDSDPKYDKRTIEKLVQSSLAGHAGGGSGSHSLVTPGECRYCLCTEDNACDPPCSWVDPTRTLCSTPDCVDAAREEAEDRRKRPVPTRVQYMHEGKALISATEAQLKRWIEGNILLKLADVPWRLDDANLVPAAGGCTTCPKRSGSNAALFGDLTAEDDVCSDPTCFAAKQDALVKRHKTEARKTGAAALLKISSKRSIEKMDAPIIQDLGYAKKVTAKTIREGQWLKAEPGSCSGVIQGLMVDGDDKGMIFSVCANQGCKVHKHQVQEAHRPMTSQNNPSKPDIPKGMTKEQWEEQKKRDEDREAGERLAIYMAARFIRFGEWDRR